MRNRCGYYIYQTNGYMCMQICCYNLDLYTFEPLGIKPVITVNSDKPQHSLSLYGLLLSYMT